MEKIEIYGKETLKGEIKISGMKNSALPIIYACILIEDECIIENVPRVSDVYNSLEILRKMGAKAEFCDTNTVIIDTSGAKNQIDNTIVSKMRASSYLMGALLSRFGECEISYPGGCNFGSRPLDIHLKGFSKLGCDFYQSDDKISLRAKNKIKSAKITLDKISVGGTINMVLASVFAEGVTEIENVAFEPHVDDLIVFLNKAGAKICRFGNSIFVQGIKRLRGVCHRIHPDMIEALTYITFVGTAGGELLLKDINMTHLRYTCDIFSKMGFTFKYETDRLSVSAGELCGADFIITPYPGIPTDLHPQLAALLCYTKNGGIVRDTVFPNRFAYVDELVKMGAEIAKIGDAVSIKPSVLHSSAVDATDLRAGAALITASLGVSGKCLISNVNYILRGYEELVSKLSSVGAKIKTI